MNVNLFTITGLPASQIAEKLAVPFDNPAAYKGVPGGADLTDIGTGWMIERATQVFGLRGLGWKLEYSPEHMQFIGLGEGKRVTAHLKYAVFSYALVNSQGEVKWFPIITSGASNNDFAYAEEGARTAAIGSGLKGLCFQLLVYKGQLDHHNAGQLLGGNDGNEEKPSGPDGRGRNGRKPVTESQAEISVEIGNGNPAVRKKDVNQILNELGYATPPTQPAASDDPGAYVIQSGKSYTGQTLHQLVEENPKGHEAGLTVLRWYANELKPSSSAGKADQVAAQKYLTVLENQAVPA